MIPARSLWCALPLFGLVAPSGAQTTTRLSPGLLGVGGDGNSRTVSISADGILVAYGSNATNLVAGDGNASDDVFVADRRTNTLVRASVDSAGIEGNAGSFSPAISADGRFVVFHSFASNLVPGDTNGTSDIFVRDLTAGTTERVSIDSLGAEAHGDCLYPTISADGRYVAFQSVAADLVAGDGNGRQDVFVHDRSSGMTFLASVDPGGVQGDGDSQAAWISSDGRYVVFDSGATNLVPSDANGVGDVFVKDLTTGAIERVSIDSTGIEGDADSFSGPISVDDRFVAFYSAATVLVPFDTNQVLDVFVHDRTLGTTKRVSVTPAGRGGNGDSFLASISADGHFVAFQSVASNLVPTDSNGTSDVFVRDTVANQTIRVSIGINSGQSNGYSAGPSMSADGRNIAFYSDATNLVPNDTNMLLDAFVHDRECSGVDPSTHFCEADGSDVHCPCLNDGGPGRGCANSESPTGARLRAAGTTATNAGTGTDSVVLGVDGAPSKSLALLLQGRSSIPPTAYGDGLRCTGSIKRLLARSVDADGSTVYPRPGDVSLSRRSADQGDPIAGSGLTRYYQVAYRESDASFCPSGGSINITNGLSLVW